MPKFAVISPTHIPRKKLEAWGNFRDGGYIAFGSTISEDLSNKTMEKIREIVKSNPRYSGRKLSQRFREYEAFLFLLEDGDYVAINNTNAGLFGIGRITSNYYFKKHAHDTGSTDPNEFYCHFRKVEWLVTSYMKRKDILKPKEKGWKPYGIISVLPEVPAYIKRILEKIK